MKNQPVRMWINAPSSLQSAHRFHGMLGLAVEEYEGTARFFPVAGDVISFQVFWSDLSPGWPEHLRIEKNADNIRRYTT